MDQTLKLAAAGGITLDSLENLKKTIYPSVVIVGSAITKANNPDAAAAEFKQAIQKGE